ncbi:MAG: KH domain-containing protein [Clostridia bacterium]
MVKLVEYIVKQFVTCPEKMSIDEQKIDDTTVQITVKLASEDMGKVIGKQGKIAKAIRTIVKSASAKEDIKYLVEITEAE